jgi:hypothetical protein
MKIIYAVISLMIIMAVSIVVFGGAGYILFVSGTDKHSNLNLVESYYKNHKKPPLVKTVVAAESTNFNPPAYKYKLINNINLKMPPIINIIGNK